MTDELTSLQTEVAALWARLDIQGRRTETRPAHDRALVIINSAGKVAVERQDRIEIDLQSLINQVRRTQLPTLFGRQITLPDLHRGFPAPNVCLRGVGSPAAGWFASHLDLLQVGGLVVAVTVAPAAALRAVPVGRHHGHATVKGLVMMIARSTA